MKIAKVIRTKYIGATNTKGACFRATCDAGQITVGYDYGLSATNNHAAVAQALADKFDWGTVTAGGELKGQKYFFVETPYEY